MKKLIAVCLLSAMSVSMFSQSFKDESIALEKKIISKAKRIGDMEVATYSMYKLIALEGDNSTYKDSLAYIYFSSRKYGSCFLISQEVLNRDPDNVAIMELKAISLESLGAVDKSLLVYEQLFALTNNNFHGYTLAKLQWTMKQYEAAYATITKVEGLNDTGEIMVTFSINQNHTQQIELLAAIPYLKGLILEDLNKNAEAKLSFEKALKIQPEFVLAKENLDRLNNQ